ncbi:MAG: sugar phosphate isomerase/epimerase [Armatimonadetes bacterium]|nr:sugar phosphate isomerase/epimerase [Armatimonadota bacterium]
MSDLKIAIMLGSLRMEPYAGMEKAREMGADALHISISGGPFSPENCQGAARKELLNHVRSLGLEISAVSGWGGEVDLGDDEDVTEHIERGKRFLEMAADLECGIWQGHIGVMPEDPTDPRWERFVNRCGEIAEHGEKVGACLAIETGPEPPPVVKRLIETIGSEAIRVNYDPANLILWPPALAKRSGEPYDRQAAWEKFMPVEGADLLGPYVVHVHAKDAFAADDGTAREVPLGEGQIDWPAFVSNLKKHGFDGYFAIEREVGENPVKDIQTALDFLRTL